ncbi:transposase [Thermoanaerobacter ethanolicus JW 200]|nr:transposase [Thermoanaerobacter ethanolicus JW 200]
MKKHEFVYDEYYDCYICPQNEILTYVTTNREGYREYKSNPEKCKNCPLREKCTQSKDYTKRIFRHIWEGYVEEAEHLRHTPYCKEVYERRKETIERVFADLKEKHGLRWTTLRGKENCPCKRCLFCCHEFKKWPYGYGGRAKGPLTFQNFIHYLEFLKKILSRYIQPLFSVLRNRAKFYFVNKLKLWETAAFLFCKTVGEKKICDKIYR